MGKRIRSLAGAQLIQLLGRRSWLAAAALLGTGLTAGALDDGFTLDDLVHRAMARGTSPLLRSSHLDLFRTATGDPAQVGGLIDAGAFPWFTVPDLRIAFWRPVAAATHALDYTLWPDAAWVMHLQNLVWYGVLIVLVGLIAGQVGEERWAGGVAASAFALDALHAEAVGWIACRNGLMASAFCLAALLAHHRWRITRATWGRWLGPALMGMGLLSGEIAVGGLGYLASYAVLWERGPIRERLVSLVGYAWVACAWMLAYALAGYGVHGSGYYVDPFGDPHAIALAVVHNAPVLLVMQLGLPASAGAWVGANPVTAPLLAWGAVSTIVAVLVLLGPVVARDRAARFWLAGMLFAVLPVCTTLPRGRLLLLVGVGAAGLLARLVVVLVASSGSSGWNNAWRVVAAAGAFALGAVHLLLAPFDVPRSASRSGREAALDEAPVRAATVGDLAGKTLVLVRAPHAFSGARWLLTDRGNGGPPRAVRTLYAGAGVITVVREDARTVVVDAPNGMLTEPVSWLFRGLHHPTERGWQVALTGVSITVRETTVDGRPRRVAFRFEETLGGENTFWLTWRAGRWEPFDLPGPGGPVRVW